MNANENPPHKIALALSGGGPLGAIYEVGAMCALEECLDGLDFTKLDHYVGVSAGSFLAASLANGISPRQMCESFIENDGTPSDTFDPAPHALDPGTSGFKGRNPDRGRPEPDASPETGLHRR